ncbi:glycosyltransferase family 31 protein [Hortaea werneckii]|nr:glycosyltransferase family 31 protein [Hortaea werneckii]
MNFKWRSKPVKASVLCLIAFIALGSLYTALGLGGPEYQRIASHAIQDATEAAQYTRANLLNRLPGGTTRTKTALCVGVPDDGTIAITVKTGATEALAKLPAQLETSLKCIKDPILVSDLAQTLGRHQIHDILATASSSKSMAKNPEFDIYRHQQRLAETGGLDEPALAYLKRMPMPEQDWRTAGKTAAWGLDKYKFLHMVEKAWELQPGRQWYVFIEDDTYLSLRGLRRFLEHYDSREKWYLGSPVKMWEHKPQPLWFGYGGSGVILSGSVVEEWCTRHPGLASAWDPKVRTKWFGDFVLADALNDELAVQLSDAWPMLHNDEPAIATFSPDTWCKTVVTMHHLDAREMDELYQAEQALGSRTLRFQDVYKAFYKPGLPFKRSDWDNLAGVRAELELDLPPNDLSKTHGKFSPESLEDPNKFYEGCEVACLQSPACFQFTHVITTKNGTEREGECHLTGVFRLGRKRTEESWMYKDTGTEWKRTWVSGWRSDRIGRFVDDEDRCG